MFGLMGVMEDEVCFIWVDFDDVEEFDGLCELLCGWLDGILVVLVKCGIGKVNVVLVVLVMV